MAENGPCTQESIPPFHSRGTDSGTDRLSHAVSCQRVWDHADQHLFAFLNVAEHEAERYEIDY